jgi:hypothetical protein
MLLKYFSQLPLVLDREEDLLDVHVWQVVDEPSFEDGFSCSLLRALENNDSLLDLVVSTVQLVSQLRQLGRNRSQLGLVDVTSDQNTYCSRNDGSDFDATVN